jgi:hypothetical protein
VNSVIDLLEGNIKANKMNPRIKSVKPDSDYTLILTFANGEVKSFDMKPYLNKGIFRELKDLRLFNSVKPCLGSIQWKNGQDLCPDTLYLESLPLSNLAASRSDKSVIEEVL